MNSVMTPKRSYVLNLRESLLVLTLAEHGILIFIWTVCVRGATVWVRMIYCCCLGIECWLSRRESLSDLRHMICQLTLLILRLVSLNDRVWVVGTESIFVIIIVSESLERDWAWNRRWIGTVFFFCLLNIITFLNLILLLLHSEKCYVSLLLVR